jgi:4-amino-4-deoxy-L-arabinose transferase-like glycosyltransferase
MRLSGERIRQVTLRYSTPLIHFFENQFIQLSVIFSFFFYGVLRNLDDSGLFMDSVNPEYWIARTLNPEIANPVWIPPTVGPPALLTLYAGAQNYYFELPIIKILGFSNFSLRFAQSLIGVFILLIVYKIISHVTSRPKVGFLVALMLAIDPSFVLSFRTQAQVLLGGLVWFLLSLYFLFKSRIPDRNFIIYLSGISYGLAVYSYFIYAFFLPALLFILVRKHRHDFANNFRWLLGLIVGLLPYAYGYLSMLLAVGSWKSTLELIKGWLVMLDPAASADESFLTRITSAVHFGYQGFLNIGNQSVLIGELSTPKSADLKWTAICLVLVGAIVFGIKGKVNSKPSGSWKFIEIGCLLFLSYVFVAAIFGGRLAPHHFILLVPLVYMGIGLSLAQFLSVKIPKKYLKSLVLFFVIIISSLSILQSNLTYNRLEETGGTGLATNALTNLAIDARQDSDNSVYIFPDWGFFMPFAFQTQNKVAYSLDASPTSIENYLAQNKLVKVAFWSIESWERNKADLENYGIKFEWTEKIYLRSDRQPAFILVTVSRK